MGVGEDGEEKRKARGRDGEGRGSPALRPVRGVSTAELSQFERRLPRPTSPDRLSVCLVQAEKESQRAPREGVSKKKKKKEPAWRRASVRGATDSLVVPPSTGVAAEAAAAAAASGTSRVRG